jgi:hypothetical protein
MDQGSELVREEEKSARAPDWKQKGQICRRQKLARGLLQVSTC